MDQPVAKSRPGVGRPTREQAERRHEELLDEALELFLAQGYELTTIDAIAASVGMTKRTIRARYADKSTLFRAVVQRAIERWIVPIETLRAVEADDLEATLVGVARLRLTNALSPAGVRLQRIINAESYRFPEIFTLAYEQGGRPTIDFLVDLLNRHAEAGVLEIEDAQIAAGAFLSMVVGGPARLIWGGGEISDAHLDERIRLTVRLFLKGAMRR